LFVLKGRPEWLRLRASRRRKVLRSLEITPLTAAPCGVYTRAHATTLAALVTQFIYATFLTFSAGIRSGGAVSAENGGPKILFSMLAK
jgi:hypothetical protein